MISWKNKMKIIWKILFLKRNSIDIEIDECLNGYKIVGKINSNITCDNHFGFRTECKNYAKYCLSRTYLNIRLTNDDHVHVCESCTNELLGKTHDFR